MDIPTRRDIEEIARNNQVLCTSLRAGQALGISWAYTLQLAVKCLVEVCASQQKSMIKMAALSGKPLEIDLGVARLKALAATVADGNFNHADVIAEAKRLSK